MRYLRPIPAVVSFAFGIAISLLLYRSYHAVDRGGYSPGGESWLANFLISRGEFGLDYWPPGGLNMRGGPRYDTYPYAVNPYSYNIAYVYYSDSIRSWAGFGWARYDRERYVWVPLWSLIVLSMILPALRVRRMLIMRFRRLPGKCPRCGYDLRASPDLCPECGTPRLAAGRSGRTIVDE